MPFPTAARPSNGHPANLASPSLSKPCPARSDNDLPQGAKYSFQLRCRVFKYSLEKKQKDRVVSSANIHRLLPLAVAQEPDCLTADATSEELAPSSPHALIVRTLALSAVCRVTNGPCSKHASHDVFHGMVLQRTATQRLIITCTAYGHYESHYTCPRGLSESTYINESFAGAYNDILIRGLIEGTGFIERLCGAFDYTFIRGLTGQTGFIESFGFACNETLTRGLTGGTHFNQSFDGTFNGQIPDHNSEDAPTPSVSTATRRKGARRRPKLLCLFYANHGYCHICRQTGDHGQRVPSAWNDHAQMIQHLYLGGIYCDGIHRNEDRRLNFKGEMVYHDRNCQGWEPAIGAPYRMPQHICPDKATLRAICYPSPHPEMEFQPYPDLDTRGRNWMISSLRYQDFRTSIRMPCETQDRFPWPYESDPPTPRVFRPALYSRQGAPIGSTRGRPSTRRPAARTVSTATSSIVSHPYGLRSTIADQDAAEPPAQHNGPTPLTSDEASSTGHGRYLETIVQDSSDSSTVTPDYDMSKDVLGSVGGQFGDAAQSEEVDRVARQMEDVLQHTDFEPNESEQQAIEPTFECSGCNDRQQRIIDLEYECQQRRQWYDELLELFTRQGEIPMETNEQNA